MLNCTDSTISANVNLMQTISNQVVLKGRNRCRVVLLNGKNVGKVVVQQLGLYVVDAGNGWYERRQVAATDRLNFATHYSRPRDGQSEI